MLVYKYAVSVLCSNPFWVVIFYLGYCIKLCAYLITIRRFAYYICSIERVVALFGHITGSIEWPLYTGLTVYINQTRRKVLSSHLHLLFIKIKGLLSWMWRYNRDRICPLISCPIQSEEKKTTRLWAVQYKC